MNKTATWIVLVIVLIAAVVLLVQGRTAGSTQAQTHDFNLTSFGVALPLPGDLTDIKAVAADESAKGPGTVYHMYAGDGCDLGAIYQIRKNAVAKSNTTWTEATLKQFELTVGNKPPQVKEFTDFYLVFEPNPNTCATDEKGQQDEMKKRAAVWGALSGAHYMSV